MGGPGSGCWYRWQGRKSTVEESLVVAMRNFRDQLSGGSAGSIVWTWSGGRKSSVGYSVTATGDGPVVTLQYRWRDSEDVRMAIRLEATPAPFGGRRWWFTCPLAGRGVACRRRAGKLYLPPAARYFGCRKCHDLTYRSCQEAHQAERAFGRLGFDPEVGRLLSKRWTRSG